MRSITIVTGSLLHFRVQGVRWDLTKHWNAAGEDLQYDVQIFDKPRAPQGAEQPIVIAEFTDVHAVYFTDVGEMVEADEE